MTCPSCGQQLPNDSTFCPSCGERIAQSSDDVTTLEDSPRTRNTAGDRSAAATSPAVDTQTHQVAASGAAAVSRATYLWAALGFLGGLIGWALVKERDAHLARNVLITGVAVSVGGTLLYFLAIGGLLAGALSSTNDTTSAGAEPTTDSTYFDPAGGSGSDLQMQPTINEFSWVYIDDVDQRVRITVLVDEPVRLADSTYVEVGDEQYAPGDACGVTDETTGIVALDFTAENESSSIAAADLDFSIDSEYERFFTSGPECFTGSSSGAWDGGIEAGESGGSVVAVFIPGYFDNGDGDPSMLEGVTLTPQATDFAGVIDMSGDSATGDGFTLMPRGGTASQPTEDTAPAASSEDVSGYYTGTMTAYKTDTVYDVVLDLTHTGSEVSGTVTATSRKTGNRGTYEAKGYFENGRVILNGKSWVDKPNSSWFMDHMDLSLNGDSLTGTYAGLDKPGKSVGDVYAVR